MLAVVGWPLAELINAGSLGTTGGRAPSLFNGGLGDGPIGPFLLAAAAYASYLEMQSMSNVNGKPAKEYVAGDFGFDPLGFYLEEGASKRKELRASELTNGRLVRVRRSLIPYCSGALRRSTSPPLHKPIARSRARLIFTCDAWYLFALRRCWPSPALQSKSSFGSGRSSCRPLSFLAAE